MKENATHLQTEAATSLHTTTTAPGLQTDFSFASGASVPTLPGMHIHIRQATENDVSAVMTVAKSQDYNANKDHCKGYLISAYPKSTYLELLRGLRVATIDDVVAGFMLAFPKQHVPSVVESDRLRIEAILGSDQDYFLIKQVGVLYGLEGRGIGTSLYQPIFAAYSHIPIIAPIVIHPEPNLHSIGYHENKWGMQNILGLEHMQSLPASSTTHISGLWCRYPEGFIPLVLPNA